MKSPLQDLMKWFNEKPEYDKSSEGYEIMQKAQELLAKEADFAREAYIQGHYDSSLDIYNPSECYYQITNN
jgi:predicted unusual protein kinase regulating ubiquinone biosynthesis (AarF/ABC1/UbiB family)